jgi:hypothetical protein
VRRTTRLLAAASLAALIAACTTSPTGRSQLMLISPESAIVQSKQAYLTPWTSWTRTTSWSTTR